MTIRAQISSDTIAVSCGITVKSPTPVLVLCRRLVEEGCDPVTPMQAYRGETLCLYVQSIGEAATLQVGSHGVGFTRAREGGSAPYSDLNAPEGVRYPSAPAGLTSASSAAA
jgi:hypothetical protein